MAGKTLVKREDTNMDYTEKAREILPEKRTVNYTQDDLGKGWMAGHNYCLETFCIPIVARLLEEMDILQAKLEERIK